MPFYVTRGDRMKFGEKVRELRKKNGMTQAELAKRAGLGLKTITNYESGATYPQNREVYSTLADILGCESSYLCSEDGESTYSGRDGVKKLVGDLTDMFAGDAVPESDMDEMMLTIQEAYVTAKRKRKKREQKTQGESDQNCK